MDTGRRVAVVLLVSAVLSGACGGTQPPEGAGSPQPVTPQDAPSGSPQRCPHPDGGSCLGPLAAGTYTTQVFQPAITYTVPDGWANYEDLPGNFLLVPPGASLEGVDAGTSDYIGIYSSTAAIDGCSEQPAAGIGHTPADIAAHLTSDVEGLAVTEPRAVSVGGLQGLVLDIELQEGFTGGCDLGLPTVVVPVIIGRPPSSFAHAVVTGLTMRLYLLERDAETLAIEVNDLQAGAALDELSRVVDQLVFAAAE
jgi:hypothetical protein